MYNFKIEIDESFEPVQSISVNKTTLVFKNHKFGAVFFNSRVYKMTGSFKFSGGTHKNPLLEIKQPVILYVKSFPEFPVFDKNYKGTLITNVIETKETYKKSVLQ